METMETVDPVAPIQLLSEERPRRGGDGFNVTRGERDVAKNPGPDGPKVP